MEESVKKIINDILACKAEKQDIAYFTDLVKGFEIPISDLEDYCDRNCIYNCGQNCLVNGSCIVSDSIKEIKGREERFKLMRKCFYEGSEETLYCNDDPTTTSQSTVHYHVKASENNTTRSDSDYWRIAGEYNT